MTRNEVSSSTSHLSMPIPFAFFCPAHPTLVSAVSTLLGALRNYKAYLGEGVLGEMPDFSHQRGSEFLTLPEAKPTSMHVSNSGAFSVIRPRGSQKLMTILRMTSLFSVFYLPRMLKKTTNDIL